MKTGVACSGFMEMSRRIRRIHVVCCAVEVAVMYSASQVESAVIDCSMDYQHMGVLLYVRSMPEMDLRPFKSAAKSASVYE